MTEKPKAKAAPRATTTSDVDRPRALAIVAAGAALGVGVAAFAGHAPVGADHPLARPHAKVACAKCHEAPAPASSVVSTVPFQSGGACKTCHRDSHVSTRPAHRALAQKGELTCATCHPAHAGAQGVTFGGVSGVVRWGAGAEEPAPPAPGIKAGTTVPLVSLGACAGCHDLTRASDPISACVPGGKLAGDPKRVAAACFDEHHVLNAAGPAVGACAKQHDADRFAAHDAARRIAATTPWVAVARAESPPWLPLGGGFAGASVLGGLALVIERRRRRAASPSAAAAPTAPPAKRKLPVVDTSTCLGCYACVDACPFDVLEIQRYVAVVARPEECCGVVLCEQVCPNGSLKIDEGDVVLDRPDVDEHLESRNVRGIFLAGDLTGLPLIKNAINQGVRAIDRIAATLPRKRSAPIDVVVVGAGPAGLSAALRAKEKGLSCVVLEQATVAASVKGFPRDKIVHDPPLDLPVEGELWLRESTKEELVAQWTRIVRARAIDVREGHRVTAIDEEGGAFVVSAGDERFRAARVVVAIGRRGTPRTLELAIEPGAETRVLHSLADARSFAGKRIVIAGLGDSAMEAAIALARQPDTSVTVTYRGSSFRRGKARNVSELEKLVADGKVKLLFEAVPTAIGRTHVTLSRGQRLPCDVLLVLIGGIPAWDLLSRFGVVRSGSVLPLIGENLRDPGT